LDGNVIEFDTLVPHLEAMVNGSSDRVVNHHFHGMAAKQAAAHPGIVGRLIEQAVVGELKSLDPGGREVWHPKDFSEALHALEQAGPVHKELVTRIQKSMEPYKERNCIYDVYHFRFCTFIITVLRSPDIDSLREGRAPGMRLISRISNWI
jgi:hypothetical protein